MGFKIAKHGNRAVSSMCGAADILEQFGAHVSLPPGKARMCLDESNFCFLFAPDYHTGVRHVMDVRRRLKTRTIFNLLGPMVNPARPSVLLVGVYDSKFVRPIAETLKRLGCNRAAVVHGNGLDEVAIHGVTLVAEVCGDNDVMEYELTPQNFGVTDAFSVSDLVGGNPEQNFEIMKSVLSGGGTAAQRSSVAVQVSLLMKLFGHENLPNNTDEVLKFMECGKAFETLTKFVKFSQQQISLQQIVSDKIDWIRCQKQVLTWQKFEDEALMANHAFYAAISAQKTTTFIFELKRASPSVGIMQDSINFEKLSSIYSKYASAISVLTDEKYFRGSFEYIKAVKRHCPDVPVLCKDFIMDDYQVFLARHAGADAVLLILKILTDEKYISLSNQIVGLGMDIVTEICNEKELSRALQLKANIIQINNRNLDDFSVNLSTTARLAPPIPKNTKTVVISASRVSLNRHARQLASHADALLVGSALMCSKDSEIAVRSLVYGLNKVCGLTRTEDAVAAYEAGAVFGGIIFVESSPRYVTEEQASEIVTQVTGLTYVGVFKDASVTHILSTVKKLNLSVVQLHGSETVEHIDRLTRCLPKTCKIWKAHNATVPFPTEILEKVDKILLDNKTGGTGQSFDWNLIPYDQSSRDKVILAGGIGPSNVEEAIKLGCAGLDFNSKLEISPGVKDHEKIRQVFNFLRRY